MAVISYWLCMGIKESEDMGAGRPSKYKIEYAEQAYKLCLLGATDKELADFFEVNEDTINEWKKAYPEFSESLKRGKEQADAVVASKLYHRAIGYEHEDTQFATYQGEITDRETYIKHYPPDTTAAIFWLKNRQREKWKDTQNHELTGPHGGPIQLQAVDLSRLSDVELRQLEELQEKISAPQAQLGLEE